jgi:hypothetical protein
MGKLIKYIKRHLKQRRVNQLVKTGIYTINEARKELGLDLHEDILTMPQTLKNVRGNTPTITTHEGNIIITGQGEKSAGKIPPKHGSCARKPRKINA